tara:strand:+ start:358 stop:672 length:315 start_codon:yes stop_codon:yes gene_type:complete
VAATEYNNAENSASIVRIIIVFFLIVVVISTTLLVLSTEFESLQLTFIILGLSQFMGLILLLFMWDSIYQMLSHIGNPGRRAEIVGTTRRGYDPTAKIRGPPPS